jgi:hypothetical protein
LRLTTLLATSLAIAPLATIASQEPPAIKSGDRVRITAPTVSGGPLVGTVLTLETDSLVVQGGTNTWRLSLASITHLDRSRGQRSHTLLGAGIGFLVGAGAGVVWGASQASCDPAGACVPFGAAVGGGGGVLLGVVVGVLVRTERWAEVPLDHLRLSLTPDRDRGLTLRASLSF